MKSRRHLPLIAVVGRPNVGKSTLFNRIVGRTEAVVDDIPGVTRDRREAVASWTSVTFRLVDTGGLVPGTQDAMEAAILNQAQLALEEADVILFLVDAREGLTSIDRDIALQLRSQADKIILAANKVEGPAQEADALEATALGFDTPSFISGQHGRGVGDLLDRLVERFPKKVEPEDDEEVIHVALVGRPNVGKSSLANRLLGEPRLIVHPEAGTTRDAVDVPFKYDGTEFVLVDTAGLRRRSHVAKGVEYYSTVRTRRSLERSDVALLVIDSSQPIASQDARIAGMISEAGKSMVFLYNKWDLVEKETGTSEKFALDLRDTFPLLTGSPVLFVSAITGQRVSRIPPTVRDLYNERRTRIATHDLNEALEEAIDRLQPPMRKNGKPIKLYYATQVADSPPAFVVFANAPQDVPDAYQSYLKNHFRDRFGLRATPIRLSFRARRSS